MNSTKISIIGAGAVGATTAYAIMLRNITAEITLIDIDTARCEGEILDISDALSLTKSSQIKRGTIQDAQESNIIVICAGARQKPGQKREELLEINKKIISSIISDLNPINPNAIIIIVTNPVDILTYYAQQISELPKCQVFGTGTFLDTQRIRGLVAKTLNIAGQSVHAYVLGEHGDSQFVAWSTASVAGKPLLDFPQINKNILDDFSQKTEQKAHEIIKHKGATFYGIAACVSAICENIIFDRKYVMPLSVYIEEFDLCMSTPVALGFKGIEKTIDIPLDKEEQKLWQASGKKLRKIINMMILISLFANQAIFCMNKKEKKHTRAQSDKIETLNKKIIHKKSHSLDIEIMKIINNNNIKNKNTLTAKYESEYEFESESESEHDVFIQKHIKKNLICSNKCKLFCCACTGGTYLIAFLLSLTATSVSSYYFITK